MNKLIRFSLALAAGVLAVPAFADDARPPLPAGAAAAHVAAALPKPMRAQATARDGAAPKAMGEQKYPGTPRANIVRVYPPSCAADPLPDAASGDVIISKRVPLYAIDKESGNAVLETVTITLWRLACSSGGSVTPYNSTGEFYNGMTLMRIDRDAQYEGDQDVYPTFPQINIAQGTWTFDNDPATRLRAAVEPNTVISETPFDSPIYYSTTYVLENYPYEGYAYFNYSDAFNLRVNPLTSASPPVDFTVPAYSPTQATYPDAFALLPFDGYAAAQWVNADRGDGLLVQITEENDANGNFSQRELVFDLLTKDTAGNTIWLVGNAAFPTGATSINVNVGYLVAYQGNNATQQPWGTAKFELVDCNNLSVTYTPNTNLPAPVPSFSGALPYTRLFSANGMLCE